MISKYRNLGLLQVAVALTLSVSFALLIRRHDPLHRHDDWTLPVCLVLYVSAWVMWVLGSLSFTRAKGYNRDLGGTLLLFFIVRVVLSQARPCYFHS